MKHKPLTRIGNMPFHIIEFIYIFLAIVLVFSVIRHKLIYLDEIQDVYTDHGAILQDEVSKGICHYKMIPQIQVITFEDSVPKCKITSVLQKVIACHPKVIALDYRFNIEKKEPGDTLLIQLIRENNIILGYDLYDTLHPYSYFTNDYENGGYANIDAIRGITQMLSPMDKEGRSSFAIKIVRRYLDRSVDMTDEILIDFEYDLDYMNSEFLDEEEYEDMKGKIIILGGISCDDIKRTPYCDMPGVRVHGLAVATLLDNLQPLTGFKDKISYFSQKYQYIIVIFLYLLLLSFLRFWLKHWKILALEDLIQIGLIVLLFWLTSKYTTNYNLFTIPLFAIPVSVSVCIWVLRKIYFIIRLFNKNCLEKSLWAES